MTVQFKFFTIAATAPDNDEEDLNRFLRSVKVISVHQQFVLQRNSPFWCLAVEYVHGPVKDIAPNQVSTLGKRIDYKQLLSPEDFSVFVKLRDWRKETAAKEAVPVYTIFTNDQLAQIVRNNISTKADLKSIDGVGESRAGKYGDAVIRILSDCDKKENISNQ